MNDDLTEAVQRLREMVEGVEADLRMANAGPGYPPPHLLRDASGRYILMDAYAALVSGLAAIEATR